MDKLKDITEGGADLTRRLKVDTSDELGDLAESMNAFLGRLQHIMSDLRESQERYLALFNNSMKLVFELQLDGRFIRANARALNLLGTNEATLGESSFVDAVVPAHAPRAREVLQFVAANGFDESIHQFRLNGANGDAPWVEVTGVRLDKDRRPYALLLVGSDMTAQKRAEDEKRQLEAHLRHTQRMEAIGRLAGGIAHDFNNLLSGIIGYANLLKLDARPGTEAYDGLDVIERAGQRAAELTKQLLGFARRGKLQNTTVDIHRTINDVVALLSRTIDKQITLECALRAEQAFVQGDPSQLEQVIMNLAVNAVDAMPGGGSVRFATDVVSNGKTPADLRQDLDMGPFLRIRVADSGGGIPEDIRERIFEPFFTTKEKGKGTGMGLATVYGIVKNHGGAVGLRSVVERGTVFCVYLPLAAPPAPAVKPEGSLTIARGTGRILVVDDESAVRRVLAAMLTRFGYQVETAEDGMKAVEVYHRRGESIDLVIIDMTMPVMNGSDCFRRLRELNPEVKVILATGHALEGSAQQLLDEGVQGFVQKPFVAAAMAQEIARILDGSTLNQPTATR